MRTVLVTGATGFVGSHLVRSLLAEGCAVRVLRRRTSDLRALRTCDVEYVEGDVRDAASVRRAVRGCDMVFHAAAIVSYWRRERESMFATNIDGTRNVADAALAAGVERFVHTSSIAAVGRTHDGSPATEATAYNWEAHDIGYRTSKHRAEIEVLAAVRRGLPAVIVNPSLIMGSGDYRVQAGRIVRDIYHRRIFYAAPGGTSVVGVDDVVRAHIAAARSGRIGERYILAGENLSFREIFGITAEVVGGWKPLVVLPAPVIRSIAAVIERFASLTRSKPWVTRELVADIDVRRHYSTEKARRELGFTARPFREVVEQTFRWLLEHDLL